MPDQQSAVPRASLTVPPPQAATPQAPLTPITAEQRLAAVDTLRGLAVFGILLVNMAFFSSPFYVVMMDLPSWTTPADRAAQWAIRAVAEGKFYTLFSLLFGLGMAIQMQRIEARGGRFAGLYVRRLLVLLLIGLCHASLLWYGDILTTYALLGFPLLLFRKASGRVLLIMALIAYSLPMLVIGASAALCEVVRLLPNAAAQMDLQVAAQQAHFSALAHASVVNYGSGTFRQILAQRALDGQHILIATLFIAPPVFTMFLLGLYVGRRGILHDPTRHRTALRRLAIWGISVGLLCSIGYATAIDFVSRAAPSLASFGTYFLHWAGTPPLSFGMAAAVVLLVQREAWRRRLSPVAAVGRMALTNYLLQTLICTTLFYSYGLGWFGKVGPAAGLALTVAIYAAQVPFSAVWLRWFRFGPLEWLWRSLTYARWQPMLKGAPEQRPPEPRSAEEVVR